ncbi:MULTISPECIES: hypothetical protein [Hyphomicrobiales]|jgi:hypothetical protein|uniref:hypothetical protein n=1 Tax=Hyphomicrobiales TaxID=356 RepID=UPI00036BB195|nr:MULTISPECIES: hypothetical protein [Phyllobacteriaceae]MCX8572899.1 hypothetical protein [Aminobacter sp. MET-1]
MKLMFIACLLLLGSVWFGLAYIGAVACEKSETSKFPWDRTRDCSAAANPFD